MKLLISLFPMMFVASASAFMQHDGKTRMAPITPKKTCTALQAAASADDFAKEVFAAHKKTTLNQKELVGASSGTCTALCASAEAACQVACALEIFGEPECGIACAAAYGACTTACAAA